MSRQVRSNDAETRVRADAWKRLWLRNDLGARAAQRERSHMTIRQFLTRRMAICFSIGLLAWLGGASSFSISTSQPDPPWFYAIFVVVFGGALLSFYRLRCPRCRTSLGTSILRMIGTSGGLGRRIDFCPYCGVSLDEPYDKTSET